MSGLKNTGLVAGGLGAAYLGINALGESGVEAASTVTSIVDATAYEVGNILNSVGVEIGNLAPVAQKFIEELGGVISNTSLLDAGIATGGALIGGYAGKKGSQFIGHITGTQSESDNKIAGVGIGAATGLGLLGATATSITIGAGTTGYVLGRKLGEKVLGEKYAKITGIVSGLACTGLAWGASSGIVLGSAAIAGGGAMIWKAGEGSRQRNATRRANKRAKKT